MWIERVIARAFGPLLDRTLELAPGLTVVGGPNEAGKTSWHAATRLALTGIRRGPGQTKVTASLIERHRPWDQPDRWEVEARLHLSDGRTIDLSQDLLGRVACRARDVVLGEDVSGEIINEGTPDASLWLGLDRESFASTVSVNQAQILAVADSAAALQEQMQRAASTRGTDATAAEAIERLRAFRKDAVGADTVVAKGPLRAAMREIESGEVALAEARRRHVAFLERSARLEAAEHQLGAAQHRERFAGAIAAREAAGAARQRADRAAALASRHPMRPPALEARDAAADEVAAALAAWERRPAAVEPTGPSSVEIEARLQAIPEPQPGDRRPAESILAALRGLDLAEEALRIHREQRLAEVAEVGAPIPAARPPALPWVAAGAVGIFGAAVVLLGQVPVGLAVMAAAVILAAWAWPRSRSGGEVGHAAPTTAQQAELARQREAYEEQLKAAVGEVEAALRAALLERSAAADGDPRAATAAYVQACADRQQQAQDAAGAEGLRQALGARRALEENTERARQAAAATEAALRAVASRAGVGEEATITGDLVQGLRAWQRARADEARGREAAILEWQELGGLLGGRSLQEFEAGAAAQHEAAERLAVVAGLDGLEAEGASPARPEHGSSVELAKEAVDALSGELRVLAADLPEVAEAEERVDAARAELDRVRRLAEVVDEAIGLLETAERRVHRDLAPVLRASIQRWLPAVSDGAYDDAAVNPRDLSIEVKEAQSGQWRDARLLSEGTREQIYLLLRVAMAEHLVTTGETAPLLLDEVTVQSDALRKRQLLEVLHTVSADRQVILFTHDAEVMAWAATALVEPRDRLVRLGGW